MPIMMTRLTALSVFVFLLATITDLTTAQNAVEKPTKENEPFKISARYHIENGTNEGYMIVKIELPKGSYIYGLGQKRPLIPSKLELKTDRHISKTKSFSPDQSPKITENDPIFKTRLEKHTGVIQFYAPITVANVEQFKTYTPTVIYSGQVCSDAGFCQSIRKREVSAKFEGFFDRQARNTLPGTRKK